jgi:hypothetical protein
MIKILSSAKHHLRPSESLTSIIVVSDEKPFRTSLKGSESVNVASELYL